MGDLLSLFFDFLEGLFLASLELLLVLVFLLFGSQSSIKNVFLKVAAVSQWDSDVGTKLWQSKVMHAFILYDIWNVNAFFFFLLRNWNTILTDLLWRILQRHLKRSCSDTFFQG